MLWRLGGRSSSFSVAADAVFGFQHHAAYEDPYTIRMFDDGGDGLTTLHPSRVAWIRLDHDHDRHPRRGVLTPR